MNALRLCFHAFIENEEGKFTIPLEPVVSNIIYDKKSVPELSIVKLSEHTCPVDGGKKELIIVCDRVSSFPCSYVLVSETKCMHPLIVVHNFNLENSTLEPTSDLLLVFFFHTSTENLQNLSVLQMKFKFYRHHIKILVKLVNGLSINCN